MANIELKIVALGDFSSVNSQLKALQLQVETLQKSVAGVGLTPQLNSQLKNIQTEFSNALIFSNNFTKSTVQLTSETEKFGQALQKGKLSLGQYFSIITGKSGEAQKAVNALAVEQVKLNNSIVQSDITKRGVYSVYTPTKINEISKATEIAAAKQNIYNIAVREGSNQLLNFGKNTQWAGRQLTVGLTMPAVLFGSQAVTAFKAVNTELTRLQRLYGVGLVAPTAKQLKEISQEVLTLGQNLAKTMGVSQQSTTATAADFAAIGRTGQDLLTSTEQAMKLSKLGSIDAHTAFGGIMALQQTFKVSSKDLAESVNFMTAIQKQTALNLTDITDALPRIGPIVKQLGGTYKDTAVMMLAMKEAGVPAAQAANAIKSAMASLISPTTSAKDAFKKFNIDLNAISTSTGGNPVKMIQALQQGLSSIAPLAREQLIEKLFGKFQFARITALLDNLGKAGSQTQLGFKIAAASAGELSTLINQEMKIATESPVAKWQIAIETLKSNLYPIGQKMIEVGTKIIDFGNKIAEFFNKLPGPIKSGLGILLTLGVISGPIIMITGLLANLMAQGMKVGYSLLGLVDGTKKWKDLMTPASIAAKTATEVFNEGILENISSVNTLTAAIDRMVASLSAINMANFASAGGIGAIEKAAVLEAGALRLPRMATGGYIPGNPAHGDAYPAMLMGGEAVIPTEQSKKYAPFINAMIHDNLPGYQDGLNVRSGEVSARTIGPLSTVFNSLQLEARRKISSTSGAFTRPGGSLLPFTSVAVPGDKDSEYGNFNSMLTGAEGASKSDYVKWINKKRANGQSLGSNIHAGLYEFLESQTHISPQDKQKIIDEIHNEFMDILSKSNERINDKDLSKITSTSYKNVLKQHFVSDPILKENFESEIQKINSARYPSIPHERNGVMETSGPSTIGLQSAGSSLPIFTNIRKRFKNRISGFGFNKNESPTLAHTYFPEFLNAVNIPEVSIQGGVAAEKVAQERKAVKKQEGISSPAKVWENEIGRPLAQGIEKGFQLEIPGISEAMKESIQKMKGQVLLPIKSVGSEIHEDLILAAKEAASVAPKFESAGIKDGKALVNGIQMELDFAKPKMFAEGEILSSNISSGMQSVGARSKIQGAFSKAFGSQSKLGSMGMMGRMGVGMGLGMVTQMASPLIDKIPGGSAINSALTGASMGMMFGPWGAAAGAALSLVTTGIGSLIAAEKQHAAEAKADFTSSADAVNFFGGKVADTEARIKTLNFVMNTQSTSTQKLASGITYTTDQLGNFNKMVKSLPADNPLSLVIKQVTNASNSQDAAKIANQFANLQQAINGITPEQSKQLEQLILTSGKQNPNSALSVMPTQISAVKQALNQALPDSKQFAEVIGQLITEAGNSGSLKNIEDMIKAIGDAAGTAAEKIAGMINYYQNIGSTGTVQLLKLMRDSGFTPVDIATAATAIQAGVAKIDFSRLKIGKVKDILSPDIDKSNKELNALKKQKTELEKKASAIQNSSTVATNADTIATGKNVDVLKAQQKALEDNLKALQNLQKQQSQKTNYATTREDLKNQILMAQSTGDNLKAQLLQQQLFGTTRDYNIQNKVDSAQNAVEKNKELLDKANAKAQAEQSKAQTAAQTATNSTLSNLNDQIAALATKISEWPSKPITIDYKEGAGATPNSTLKQNDQLPDFGTQIFDKKTKTIKTAGKDGVPAKDPSLPNENVYPIKYHPLRGTLVNYSMNELPKMARISYTDTNGYTYDTLTGLVRDKNKKLIGQWASKNANGEMIGYAQGGVAGGHISGPGSATSDSIPAMLSNGEYVIKADSVSHYGKGFFDSVNAKHFAKGGVARTNSSITYHKQHMNRQARHFAKGGYAGAGDPVTLAAYGIKKFWDYINETTKVTTKDPKTGKWVSQVPMDAMDAPFGPGDIGAFTNALKLMSKFGKNSISDIASLIKTGHFTDKQIGAGLARRYAEGTKSDNLQLIKEIPDYWKYVNTLREKTSGDMFRGMGIGKYLTPGSALPKNGLPEDINKAYVDIFKIYENHLLNFMEKKGKSADILNSLVGKEFLMGPRSWTSNPSIAKTFAESATRDYKGKPTGLNPFRLKVKLNNTRVIPISKLFPDLTYAGGESMNEFESVFGGKFKIDQAGRDGLYLSQVFGKAKGGMINLPSFDIGTNYVPHDMIAQIHKGEAIIPASQNNGTMGSTYNVTVNAGSNANPNDIAKAVTDALKNIESRAKMSGRISQVGGR